MEIIKRNSPEYRAFAAAAIVNNEWHILEQLRNVILSNKPHIRLIEGF